MADWVALDTSTDRAALARQLERTHFAMASGGSEPRLQNPRLRPVVSRSWARSTVAGVDPAGGLPPRVMDGESAHGRWVDHPLASAEPVVRRLLDDIGDDTNLAAICDAEGTLLWTAGRPAAVDLAHEGGIAPGTLWAETAIGTNGLGTALQEAHPVQIFSGEHFAAPMHRWVCSAAPIRDPLSGEVIGALDITGGFATAHPHSLAVVSLAAGAIEQQLLVDAHVQARRVLRLPEASLAVLGRNRGLLRIGRREIELSRRHTEMLLLLWLRPEGLTAEQLALEVYGEHGRPGSVRTEMHRLRGHLGSLLGERPYRILGYLDCDLAAVESRVRQGDVESAMRLYRGVPLAQTEVPRLVELRERLDDAVRAGVLATSDVGLMEAWLQLPRGQDDYEVSRRLAGLLGRDDPRRAAERARLRRLVSEDKA